jgi:hypothetical protein
LKSGRDQQVGGDDVDQERQQIDGLVVDEVVNQLPNTN